MAALRLLLDWGADEAVGEQPIDRFAVPPPAPSQPPPVLRVDAAPAADLAALDTLDALHAALDGSGSTALRATATHTVRPDGNPAAKLVVVGEAPGNDDDRSGRAFSGAAGVLLDRLLASAGLGRGTMLLTTLVPWRPPGNRRLSESEVQACLPFLLRLLALVRPTHVLLLGAAPLRAVTGRAETVRRVRGRWLDVQVSTEQISFNALAMPPLDQWLQNAASRRETWADLIRLRLAVTSA